MLSCKKYKKIQNQVLGMIQFLSQRSSRFDALALLQKFRGFLVPGQEILILSGQRYAL